MKTALPIRARRGLTLMELAVVLTILASLAAIVVPRLDFLKNQADHAIAANTAAELTTLLQTYKTSSGNFPTLDLLVDTAGAAYPKVYSEGGAPLTSFSVPTDSSVSPVSQYYRSLLEGGLLFGWRHDPAAADASNSAALTVTDFRTESVGGTLTVAQLINAGSYAPAILTTLFPGGVTYDATGQPVQTAVGVVPPGVTLIAMGVGPKSGMVGHTMTSTPQETDSDNPNLIYCRYIAIFAIYASGKPAQLKMVVDHRFKQIGKRVEQYKQLGATGN